MAKTLLEALQNPSLYPHPVHGFEVIQTHLSWIILTGLYAYKLKKPLNLGFQDFTTLEKRKKFCEMEVSLNQRLAPDIYIEVIPITGSISEPSLKGTGEIIEYAVKMNQFEQKNLLSNLVKENRLNKEIIQSIAKQTAHFHAKAQRCDSDSEFGSAKNVYAPMKDNFEALKNLPASSGFIEEISQIESWCEKQFHQLKGLISARKKNGFVRATHGDFHLGNMVLIKDNPVIFDCIEFNENFRWTDVMNDIAFLAMDLDHHHHSDLGDLFVNHYFEHSFDYEGAKLLNFYKSYRAMVRAKISALLLNQVEPNSELAQKLALDLRNFLRLGLDYAKSHQATLSITHGFSGSGKSLFTEQLMMQTGAIRLRADVVRKHLFKMQPYDATASTQLPALYSDDATQKVYSTLCELAKMLLQSGLSVIVDATFLKQWQRDLFIGLSEHPFTIYAFEAPVDKLQERIKLRARLRKDPSDADEEVLMKQQQSYEGLTAHEKSQTIMIDAAQIDRLIEKYLID